MMSMFLIMVLVWVGMIGIIIFTIIEAVIKPFMIINDITVTFKTKTGKRTLYVTDDLISRFRIEKEQV